MQHRRSSVPSVQRLAYPATDTVYANRAASDVKPVAGSKKSAVRKAPKQIKVRSPKPNVTPRFRSSGSVQSPDTQFRAMLANGLAFV
jgi:hypothetical protein